MAQVITSQACLGLQALTETCDIADQGFDGKLEQISSTVSLDKFSDESTIGEHSDLEGGLSEVKFQGEPFLDFVECNF